MFFLLLYNFTSLVLMLFLTPIHNAVTMQTK